MPSRLPPLDLAGITHMLNISVDEGERLQPPRANQALNMIGSDRSSRLATCLAAAQCIHTEARDIVDGLVKAVRSNWEQVCDEAALPMIDRPALMGVA